MQLCSAYECPTGTRPKPAAGSCEVGEDCSKTCCQFDEVSGCARTKCKAPKVKVKGSVDCISAEDCENQCCIDPGNCKSFFYSVDCGMRLRKKGVDGELCTGNKCYDKCCEKQTCEQWTREHISKGNHDFCGAGNVPSYKSSVLGTTCTSEALCRIECCVSPFPHPIVVTPPPKAFIGPGKTPHSLPSGVKIRKYSCFDMCTRNMCGKRGTALLRHVPKPGVTICINQCSVHCRGLEIESRSDGDVLIQITTKTCKAYCS